MTTCETVCPKIVSTLTDALIGVRTIKPPGLLNTSMPSVVRGLLMLGRVISAEDSLQTYAAGAAGSKVTVIKRKTNIDTNLFILFNILCKDSANQVQNIRLA